MGTNVLNGWEGTDSWLLVAKFHDPLKLGAYVALDEIEDPEPSGGLKPVPITDLLKAFRKNFHVKGGSIWGLMSLPQLASGDNGTEAISPFSLSPRLSSLP